MTAKQSKGSYALDSSKYGCPTDGVGTLTTVTTTSGNPKQLRGSQAPDNSIYMTITDGSGTLQ